MTWHDFIYMCTKYLQSPALKLLRVHRRTFLRNHMVSARVRNFLRNGHPWAENRNRKSWRTQFFETNPMEYTKTFSELSFEEIHKFIFFEIRPPNFWKFFWQLYWRFFDSGFRPTDANFVRNFGPWPNPPDFLKCAPGVYAHVCIYVHVYIYIYIYPPLCLVHLWSVPNLHEYPLGTWEWVDPKDS